MFRLFSAFATCALFAFAAFFVWASYYLMRISLDVEPGLGATYALLSVFTAVAAIMDVVGAFHIGLRPWRPWVPRVVDFRSKGGDRDVQNAS